MSDQFPIHEDLNELDGRTVYKSSNWWKAVVLYEGFSGRKISIYLWKQKEGSWKRKQKYVIESEDDWEADQEAVQSLIKGLTE